MTELQHLGTNSTFRNSFNSFWQTVSVGETGRGEQMRPYFRRPYFKKVDK